MRNNIKNNYVEVDEILSNNRPFSDVEYVDKVLEGFSDKDWNTLLSDFGNKPFNWKVKLAQLLPSTNLDVSFYILKSFLIDENEEVKLSSLESITDLPEKYFPIYLSVRDYDILNNLISKQKNKDYYLSSLEKYCKCI